MVKTIVNNKNDKWLTLVGTIISMFALGTIYAWSLFNHPLSDKFGWRVEDVAFTFAIISISLSVASLFSSKLRCMFGVQKVTAACGIVIAIGLLLASKASTLLQLYLTAGILVGAADGIAYMMILANCLKWFPNSRGIVSGVSVASFGIGSFVFKHISFNVMAIYGVSQTFVIWACIMVFCTVVGAIFLRSADEPSCSKSFIKGRNPAANLHTQDYTWTEMVRTKQFWLLAFTFFCCCMSGLFLIAVANDLALEWANLKASTAATAVSLVAISNTGGRLILGKFSDNIPRIRIVSIICIIIFLSSLILIFLGSNPISFFTCISFLAFGFGGAVAVFPALMGDFFGLQNMTKNYSIIYQGFGIGGVVGMFISVWLGGFSNTFILVCILSFISLIITLFIEKPVKVNRLNLKKNKR